MTVEVERGPELGVEYYRGADPWIIATPLSLGPPEMTREELIQRATFCPHWEYQEIRQDVQRNEAGKEILIVTERCQRCTVAVRTRFRPTGPGGIEEVFRPVPPAEAPCPFEKVFRFPTFVVLVRRMMGGGFRLVAHVEAGEHEQDLVLDLEAVAPAIYSGSALLMVKDMRRILRMGLEKYVDYFAFLKGLKTAGEREEAAAQARELLPVAEAAGEAALAEAEPALTAEAEREAVELADKIPVLVELGRLETEFAAMVQGLFRSGLTPDEVQRRIAPYQADLERLRERVGIVAS